MKSLQILKFLILVILLITSGCLNDGTTPTPSPPNEHSTAISTQKTELPYQDSDSVPSDYAPSTTPEVVYPAVTLELGKTFQRRFTSVVS